jgi:hypothetical protein
MTPADAMSGGVKSKPCLTVRLTETAPDTPSVIFRYADTRPIAAAMLAARSLGGIMATSAQMGVEALSLPRLALAAPTGFALSAGVSTPERRSKWRISVRIGASVIRLLLRLLAFITPME